ncbi:MAG: DUF2802 domain-containing protein [Pseudomonadota bacterium]
MPNDAIASSLLAQLTPELLAASLLVLASLCFFCGTLVLLLVIAPRLRPLREHAAPFTPELAVASAAAPSETAANEAAPARRRNRRRRPQRGPSAALATPQEQPDGRDFSREILLAQQGSDADQLMRDCGLTQLEANLVVKLYGRGGPEPVSAAVG